MKLRNIFQDKVWLYPVFVLCLYGFFANLRPAQPFYTQYMIGPYKNFTKEEVSNEFSPIWTCCLLFLQLPVCLFTDMFHYKPTIIIQGLFHVISCSLLCFGYSILAMQWQQFALAMVSACEVAYHSYIYSMVTEDHYQKITSYCRGITLVGHTMGALLGQILVSFSYISYFYLNIISLGCASVALVISFILPMPSEMKPINNLTQEKNINLLAGDLVKSFKQLWLDFRKCYSYRKMLYWSLWWALVTCGYNQVINYAQMLWNSLEPSDNFSVLNGGVEALAALLGSVLSFCLGHFKEENIWGELVLGLIMTVGSAAVFTMVFIKNIYVCYAGYIIFKASYMIIITIIMLQIALNLSKARQALVFGMNSFLCLLLQALLALIVGSRGFNIGIKTQFIIYGSYYIILASIFLTSGIYMVTCIK